MTEIIARVRRDEKGVEWVQSRDIVITSASGFHARPAAKLATEAKKLNAEINLIRGSRSCNAKSVVSVMGMAIEQGQSVILEATGPDAERALELLAPIIAGDHDEAGQKDSAKEEKIEKTPPQEPPAHSSKNLKDNQISGIPASTGLAVGTVQRLVRSEITVKEMGESLEAERALLAKALIQAKERLAGLSEEVRGRADAAKAAIFEAHAELLDDPSLLDAAGKMILSGKSAAYAWREATRAQQALLAALPNAYLAERAVDMGDVGRMVLGYITGVIEERPVSIKGSIIIAEELAPSDTATLDPDLVVGFCTVVGGATSHVSILARSLGIPAIVGIDRRVLDVPDGKTVILDGSLGVLTTSPSEQELKDARERVEANARRREQDIAASENDAVTRDGRHVDVAANIGSDSDASKAVTFFCDGVGLLRSEFLFHDRREAPSEEEQAEIYIKIAKTIGDRKPLVVRTLDVGGDKPLPYIVQPKEDNPFLGLRGIRLCLEQKELFATQLRAILRAADFCQLHIMFPMISTLSELRRAKAILEEQKAALGVYNVKVGIMIEVPSAAILARHFAEEVDFLSIGTNDLTQYTLAADRGNALMARIADGLDPAVLALIGETVSGAEGNDCWVGVCGGVASDPLAVPMLIGLGVDELSVSVSAIPAIKARVRDLSFEECRASAAEVLELSSADEVRTYLRSKFGTE